MSSTSTICTERNRNLVLVKFTSLIIHFHSRSTRHRFSVVSIVSISASFTLTSASLFFSQIYTLDLSSFRLPNFSSTTTNLITSSGIPDSIYCADVPVHNHNTSSLANAVSIIHRHFGPQIPLLLPLLSYPLPMLRLLNLA